MVHILTFHSTRWITAWLVLCVILTMQATLAEEHCTRTDSPVAAYLIQFLVPETNERGSVMGTLPLAGIATGPNPEITLNIESLDPLFYLQKSDPKVVLYNGTWDADVLQQLFMLKVNCQPIGAQSISFDLFITPVDINDNAPVFINSPYHFSISELAEPNTVVYRGVRAEDADSGSNGAIKYSVLHNPEDPESNRYFSFLQANVAKLSLIGKLDYETKKEWRLLIQAMDSSSDTLAANINTTTITITVLDGDDIAPYFVPCKLIENQTLCESFSYQTNITEKMSYTMPLIFEPGPIHAVDGDQAVVDPSPIFYDFVSGVPGNFEEYLSIDASSGNISLLKPVRHSEIQKFHLVIEASEGLSPSSLAANISVKINVDEINNHRPEFASSSIKGYVMENSAAGSAIFISPNLTEPLIIQAFDRDLEQDEYFNVSYFLHTDNAEVAAELVGPSAMVVTVASDIDKEQEENFTVTEECYRVNSSDYFQLSSTVNGTSILKKLDNVSFNREVTPCFFVAIYAVEKNTKLKYESDPLVIEVTVLDENDNPPYFINISQDGRYSTQIMQSSHRDTQVLQIEIADVDSSQSLDSYIYSLKRVSNQRGSRAFDLHVEGNVITVLQVVSGFELELGDYILELSIKDGELEPAVSAYIDIKVMSPTGSSGPFFASDVYAVSVSEGLPVSTLITTVTTIGDSSLPIMYSIIAGNADSIFSINAENGEITLLKELDREIQNRHELLIQAATVANVSKTVVNITVLDINDNNPIIDETSLTFVVAEGIAGEYVGTVKATDADDPTSPNSQIDFSISSNLFVIDRVHGTITTAVALDIENMRRVEFEVTAQDRGQSPRTDTASIVVILQDVNEFKPVFDPAVYEVNISENVMIADFVTVMAFDRDVSASLRYELVAGNMSMFSVNPLTGAVSLLTSLDYEDQKEFFLELRVIDAHSNDSAMANITIHVQDENDNAPLFSQKVYEVEVNFNVNGDTAILDSILATDGDKQGSPNAYVTYSVYPDEERFYFLDESQGILATRGFNKDIQELDIVVRIIATDHGTPPLSGEAEIIIKIKLDRPLFRQNQMTFTDLMEGVPANTLVGNIKALSNHGDDVIYDIIGGNVADAFWIVSNNSVGSLYTSKVLDRETVSTYTLQIRAEVSEQETARRKRRETNTDILTLTIELADVNDNPPIFHNDTYYSGISENAKVGTFVTKIEVSDLDGVPSNLLFTLRGESPIRSESEDEYLKPKFVINEATGVVKTNSMLNTLNTHTFTYQVTVQDRDNVNLPPSSAQLLVTVIKSSNRVIIASNISSDLIDGGRMRLEYDLSELFGAHVVIEHVEKRQTGEYYEEIDETGSDVHIFVLEDHTGTPWTSDEIMTFLQSNNNSVARIYNSIQAHSRIIIIRKPGVPENNQQTQGGSPSVQFILLIVLACVVLVFTVGAIFFLRMSWKKRAAEKEENNIYLPMYGNAVNSYRLGSTTNPPSDGNTVDKQPTLPQFNPVLLRDQCIQVGSSQLQERQSQERFVTFGPEPTTSGSSNSAAKGIPPELPDRDYLSSPLSNGKNEENRYENTIPKNMSLPHVPEEMTLPSPTPPPAEFADQNSKVVLPSNHNHPTYRAYDNPSMDLTDEMNGSLPERQHSSENRGAVNLGSISSVNGGGLATCDQLSNVTVNDIQVSLGTAENNVMNQNRPLPNGMAKFQTTQFKSKSSDHVGNGHITRETNGHINGHTNGDLNGQANGHLNGQAKVHVNGHANGHLNGHIHTNGIPTLTVTSSNSKTSPRQNRFSDDFDPDMEVLNKRKKWEYANQILSTKM